MDKKSQTDKAFVLARDAQTLLDAIRAEFDLYKVTVHNDYQAMSDSMQILGDQIIALQNTINTHVHGYTDIDNTGTVQNKTTGTKAN
ncbi:hypothetical protein [Sulfuricurvum sp.]|uniref:hypothetical protein n=1 Tax=Sulfuricurvum sp. TaxID=2025608 RepID=UPI00261F4C7F|nr:hypothetical protein [Sulfuricurvum sp.]MDD2267455.1 hypothetical protein [Sulfuricurvum sp.]MDD2782823.1 hypothetical protein [Sulfuricurvum sp.]